MNIYGRSQSSDSELEMLGEVSVLAEPFALRELASFLYQCADAIEDQGEEWENGHFESSEVVSPQVVVFNPNIVNV